MESQNCDELSDLFKNIKVISLGCKPLDVSYNYDDWHIMWPYVGDCSGVWRVGLIRPRQSLSPGGSVSFTQRKSFTATNYTHNCSLRTNSVKLATKEPG